MTPNFGTVVYTNIHVLYEFIIQQIKNLLAVSLSTGGETELCRNRPSEEIMSDWKLLVLCLRVKPAVRPRVIRWRTELTADKPGLQTRSSMRERTTNVWHGFCEFADFYIWRHTEGKEELNRGTLALWNLHNNITQTLSQHVLLRNKKMIIKHWFCWEFPWDPVNSRHWGRFFLSKQWNIKYDTSSPHQSILSVSCRPSHWSASWTDKLLRHFYSKDVRDRMNVLDWKHLIIL